VKIRPVRLPPWAAGARPTSSILASGSPKPASGLAQWGPKATAEFTGTNDPRVVVAAIKALRDKGNEIDLHALRGLIKAMGS